MLVQDRVFYTPGAQVPESCQVALGKKSFLSVTEKDLLPVGFYALLQLLYGKKRLASLTKRGLIPGFDLYPTRLGRAIYIFKIFISLMV
jgi:hypothetical protein